MNITYKGVTYRVNTSNELMTLIGSMMVLENDPTTSEWRMAAANMLVELRLAA